MLHPAQAASNKKPQGLAAAVVSEAGRPDSDPVAPGKQPDQPDGNAAIKPSTAK
jgi:hypothetical protein